MENKISKREILVQELEFLKIEKKKCTLNSDRYKFIQAVINYIITEINYYGDKNKGYRE
jgi:hypothetical protein